MFPMAADSFMVCKMMANSKKRSMSMTSDLRKKAESILCAVRMHIHMINVLLWCS